MRVHPSTSVLQGNRCPPPSCLLMAGVQETWTPTQPGAAIHLKHPHGCYTVAADTRLLTVPMACSPKCSKPNVGLLGQVQRSQSADTRLWGRKVLVDCRRQARSSDSWCFKGPDSRRLQERIFKDGVRERDCGSCDQLTDSLLTDWW